MSNYWQLVRLDGTRQRRDKEVESAKDFSQERIAAEVTSDALIQPDLLQLMRTTSTRQQQAEICLRCFISQQIEQVYVLRGTECLSGDTIGCSAVAASCYYLGAVCRCGCLYLDAANHSSWRAFTDWHSL